jgi:hypothetical protein
MQPLPWPWGATLELTCLLVRRGTPGARRPRPGRDVQGVRRQARRALRQGTAPARVTDGGASGVGQGRLCGAQHTPRHGERAAHHGTRRRKHHERLVITRPRQFRRGELQSRRGELRRRGRAQAPTSELRPGTGDRPRETVAGAPGTGRRPGNRIEAAPTLHYRGRRPRKKLHHRGRWVDDQGRR